MLKRADRDERVKERLTVLHLGKLPEGQLQNWKPVIEEIIKQNLGERYGRRGVCNTIWPQRKQLLMERYGIEWFTPKELNPWVCFD